MIYHVRKIAHRGPIRWAVVLETDTGTEHPCARFGTHQQAISCAMAHAGRRFPVIVDIRGNRHEHV